MKCFAKLGALALFFFATSAVANEEPEDVADSTEPSLPSDVYALKTDGFKDFVSSHPLVLAECMFSNHSRRRRSLTHILL